MPMSARQLRLLLAAVLLRAAPAVARHDRRSCVSRASPVSLRCRCRLGSRGRRARPVRQRGCHRTHRVAVPRLPVADWRRGADWGDPRCSLRHREVCQQMSTRTSPNASQFQPGATPFHTRSCHGLSPILPSASNACPEVGYIAAQTYWMELWEPRLQYLHDLLHWLDLRRERRVQKVVIHLVQPRRQILQEPASKLRVCQQGTPQNASPVLRAAWTARQAVDAGDSKQADVG